MNIIDNNLQQNNNINNLEIEKQQNNFLETTFGKTINAGLDIGLRMILPDLIENQIIEIKDTLLKEGLGEGIKKAIYSAVDLGKSALGIVTGDFENISQVQAAVQTGGLIDGVSDTIDFVLEKTKNSGMLSETIANTIKVGKNTLLNSISNNSNNNNETPLNTVADILSSNNNSNNNNSCGCSRYKRFR